LRERMICRTVHMPGMERRCLKQPIPAGQEMECAHIWS